MQSQNVKISYMIGVSLILLVQQAQGAVYCPEAISDKDLNQMCREKVYKGYQIFPEACRAGYDTFRNLCKDKKRKKKSCHSSLEDAELKCKSQYLYKNKQIPYDSCIAGAKAAHSRCRNE